MRESIGDEIKVGISDEANINLRVNGGRQTNKGKSTDTRSIQHVTRRGEICRWMDISSERKVTVDS